MPHIIGYNLRPTEIQAVIGIEQLKKLNQFNVIRNILSKYIIKNLSFIKGIKVPISKQKNSFIVHHLICLQYNENETVVSKKRYMKALEKEGIKVSNGYPYTLDAIYHGFKNKGVNYKKGLCPVAEKVIKKSIWINN